MSRHSEKIRVQQGRKKEFQIITDKRVAYSLWVKILLQIYNDHVSLTKNGSFATDLLRNKNIKKSSK